MEYRIDGTSGDVTVVFQGDITFSENVAFRAMLKELAAFQMTSCTLDLSGVGLVDSAGLGMFLIAKEQSDTAGFKLKVKGAQGHVASMLKLTKLSEMLED